MTETAPPQATIPPGPSPAALLIAHDLVTRYRLRLADERDSRLIGLYGTFELAAAAWTGERAAFVGFYEPPLDAAEAGHDLAARCEAARRWGTDRLAIQGAKRCDILLVALRPIGGSISIAGNPADPVNVGAVWLDLDRGEAAAVLPVPAGLPSVPELRARVRAVRDGAPVPTLAAVDLAERQAVSGGYAQPVQRQLITQPVATYGLIASFVAIFLAELALIHPQASCATPSCADQVPGLFAFGALVNNVDPSQWWRFVSSAFLHDNSDVLHIAFNGLAMLWIGRIVEQLYGKLVLIGVFLLTAAIGGLVTVAAGALGLPSAGGLTVGASGGIMGLVGMLLMLGRVQGKSVPVGVAFGIRRYAITVILLTIGFGFLFPNVNNYAHVGGLLAGVLLGAILPPMRRVGGRNLLPVETGVLAGVIGVSAVALILAAANLVSVLQSGVTLV